MLLINLQDFNEKSQTTIRLHLFARLLAQAADLIYYTYIVNLFIFLISYRFYSLGLIVFNIILFSFDFPSALLADIISHKKILVISQIFNTGAVLVLVFSRTSTSILIYFILAAIGLSQASGAFSSYIENRLKLENDEADHEKLFEDYGKYLGNLRTFTLVFSVVTLGFISLLLLYTEIQSLILLLLIINILALLLYASMDDISEENEETITFKEYRQRFAKTLKFMNSDKNVRNFLLLTLLMLVLVNVIWYDLFFWPLLLLVSGSFTNVGYYRIFILLIATISTKIGNILSEKVSTWKNKMNIGNILSNFGTMLLVTIVIYIDSIFSLPNILVMVLVIICLQFFNLFNVMWYVAISTFFIKHIPDDIRNSFYSVFYSLTSILSIPVLLIFSIFLESTAMITTGMLILSGLLGINVILTALIVNKISVEMEEGESQQTNENDEQQEPEG